ncbi:MAG TPA: NUDIX hydrolase [Acidimicrobiales bacterium]|nr:NUDIX hydrolase [Acidimicrobiales bacterium]
MPSPEGEFRRIGERERLPGHFIRLVTGTFVDPDGFTFEREIVRHLGAVCVVAMEDDGGHILCVRQYRPPLDSRILELPAGKMDVPGEDAELCARRELVEEVGREAGTFTELGRFYNSPGFTDELTVCFLAEGLVPVARAAHGIEEQHMTVERVALREFWDLVGSGEIIDAKTIIGVSLAERLLASRRASG